jgi:hypothetical protein
MSRISKYLKQTCSYEQVVKDNSGKPVMNAYGELEYSAAQPTACRRESHITDVETLNGAVVKSSNRYITTTLIGINDKLDGKVVLTTSDYINSAGVAEGYRSVT